ncbi:beta-N-acetylhexosaminidase [Nevskia sp.]|uniref:beta-N-acetylhexosaminidase n=1 Tax=Nevskia sp. TaxID=1929292 RepID=UPI0025F286E0|nr:beta-N-acetylhexosaminidase [Nevskia sp.]
MTLGPIMADVGGLSLTAEDRDVLAHPLVGGVILFARNYSDPDQLRALCNELLAIKSPRLLIAVDHEGGRVQRFRVGFTRVPAMGTLSRLHEESPSRAVEDARLFGETIGRELASFGIDLCFAPVLDRDCGVSTVIGDRAFSSDPELIIKLARAFRSGLNAAGLKATGKHFPGHGAVAADSHLELPIDRRQFADIEARDLVPFKALIDDGIESLMLAHVRYSAFDDIPASFSRKWIRGLLRSQYKYNGAVFCDDLCMKGAVVVGDIVERARIAIAAGCDMLPVCNERGEVVKLLDALPVKERRLSSARLKALYRSDT